MEKNFTGIDLTNIPRATLSENDQRKFISTIFFWMFLGLLVTAVISFFVSSSELFISKIFSSSTPIFILLLAEIGIVIWLNSSIHKLSFSTAFLLFIVYALLNGITLSIIMMIYTKASIFLAFGVTAGTFGVMSLIGYTTKTNLLQFRSIFLMALVGLIITSLVNLFLKSSALYWIVSAAGVLIFTALIAYDTQKIKYFLAYADADVGTIYKFGILAALSLYLDFINLFLFILRFLGRRK